MKITKRIVSVLLALLLVFGSVSILANASASDVITVRFEYYRENENGEWIETNKIARGDTVKARLVLDTTFTHGVLFMFLTYPNSFMSHEFSHLPNSPAYNKSFLVAMNGDNSAVSGASYQLNSVTKDPGYMEQLIDDGGGEYEPYLPASYFDEHDWMTSGTESSSQNFQFKAEDGWVAEYQFKVYDDATGEGYVEIPEGSIMAPGEQEAAVSYVSKIVGGKSILSMNEEFTWDVADDNKLTLDNTVTFNDGTNVVTSTGYIGETLAAENIPADPAVGGKVFLGWVPSTVENPTEDDVVDVKSITYDYEATTYNALYRSADKVVTINANYTDVTTNTAAVAAKDFETQIGNTVKIVETLPATQEEKTTYILYSDLPTVPYYEFDAANTPAENLTFVVTDTDAVMNINYKPVDYTATFEPANGEAATTIKEAYNTEITAPAAPEKANSKFTGWSNGTETIQPGDKFNIAGNVTYTAQYENLYNVTYAYEGEIPDGYVPDAATTTTAGATIAAPAVEAPRGYELVWNVTGATENADGSYTAGANDVAFVGTWAKKTTTLSFIFEGDYPEDAEPIAPITVKFGDGDGVAISIINAYMDEKLPEGYAMTVTDMSGFENMDSAYPTVGTEPVSITITWNRIPQKITYAYEGDVPAGYESSVEYVSYKDTITLETPAEEGYTFKGWTVEGADYNAETGVVTVGTTAATITGTWAKNYIVTYEFVGSGEYPEKVPAIAAPEAVPVIKGDKVVVPEALEADGFNFIEWTVDDADAIYDAETDSYIVNGDVTVTGTWEAIEYKYRYYLDDEMTILFSTKTYTYGDEPMFVDVPTEEQLTAKGFDGWEAFDWIITEYDENVNEDNIFDTVEGNVNFVVEMYQKEYYVEFYNRDDDALLLENDDTGIMVLHGEEIDPSIVVESADVIGYTATGKWHIGDFDGEIAEFPYTVTEDIAFYADYEINKHSIIYYADEEGTVVFESFTFDYETVITEDFVPAGVPGKEGYTFTAWIEESTGSEIADYIGNSMIDEDIYVYPEFDVNSYTITWVVDGNETTTTQEFGAAIEKIADPDKTGYTFEGWATTENGAVVADLGTVPANNDTTFYAVFAGKDDIEYTINKYFMNADGTYEGVEADTETAYGVAGEKATYTPAEVEGFTFDDTQANVLEGTIAGDGSLELTVYYARNKVDVTIDGVTEQKFYGSEIATPATTPDGDPGYEFDKWVYEDGTPVVFPVTVGTDAIVINPTFKASTDTEYIVEIYTMDTEGNYGAPVTEVKTGTTGTEATYDPVAKEGFTTDAESYKTVIKADTSDTIKVYYARDKYNVIYIANDAEVDRAEVYYGAEIIASADYTAPAGYNLLGWALTEDAETPDTNFGTMGTADVTLYAVIEAADSTYTIKTYTMGLDGVYGEAVVTTATGTTDTEVTYVAPAIVGFTADKADYTVVVKADDSDVIEVYYARNKVNVTIDGETSQMFYEASLATPATPDAPAGQSFDKWVYADGSAVEFPVVIGISDIVINSTFKNNYYTVEFIVNDAAYASGDDEFGSTIEAPIDPEIAGYTFKGWSLSENGAIVDLATMTVPVDGITFYAVFEAADSTYTIETYTMGLDGVYGEAVVTTATATTDTEVTYVAPVIEGFTADKASYSVVVKADDSDVIKVYYSRNKSTVEVNGVESDMYYGAVIESIEAPKAATGFEFGGWTYEDGTPVGFPLTVGTEDIVIVPVWNKLSFNLTFKDDNGNVISGPTSTEYDADITAPEVEDKEGYTFIGWIAEVTGEKFNGKMPAKDVVYVETWNNGNYVPYKVETYIMNLDGEYELTTEVYGSALTGNTQGITANEIEGFTVDAEKSVLSAVIVGDGSTVLKAYYARDKFTVTFDGENATEIFFGEALPVVEPVAQTGKTFTGWVVEGTNEAAPATMPAKNVALVSTWSDTTYTITYIVEGVIIATDEYTYGEAVTAPADPEAYGKKFVKWTPAVPATMPAENLIISAIFDSAIFKVTFVDFDGNAFVEMQVRAGDEIVLPVEAPTKQYYNFIGWLDVPATMPTEDIIIKPNFERVGVVLVPEEGSTTVIDRENMVIYGLEIFLDEALIDEYLAVEGDGYYKVIPVANGCYGTGTVVEVYDRVSGDKLETFHIVIFGDLNGDARINAVDAAMADDESLMLTDWSLKQIYKDGELVDNENYKVYMAMAADLIGHDGRIDAQDVSEIRATSLGTVVINQVEGFVER